MSGGFFVFEPGFLDYLSPDEDCVLEREPLERCAADGQLMAYEHKGYWQCMDTLRDWEKLEEAWTSGRLRGRCGRERSVRGDLPGHVGAGDGPHGVQGLVARAVAAPPRREGDGLRAATRDRAEPLPGGGVRDRLATHHERTCAIAATLRAAFAAAAPAVVFHLAAQPIVRRGYAEPYETMRDEHPGHRRRARHHPRAGPSLRGGGRDRATSATRTARAAGRAARSDRLGGDDPVQRQQGGAPSWSSSAYRRSFFAGRLAARCRVATARAGNVIGGGDWAEDRIVPDCVRAHRARAEPSACATRLRCGPGSTSSSRCSRLSHAGGSAAADGDARIWRRHGTSAACRTTRRRYAIVCPALLKAWGAGSSVELLRAGRAAGGRHLAARDRRRPASARLAPRSGPRRGDSARRHTGIVRHDRAWGPPVSDGRRLSGRDPVTMSRREPLSDAAARLREEILEPRRALPRPPRFRRPDVRAGGDAGAGRRAGFDADEMRHLVDGARSTSGSRPGRFADAVRARVRALVGAAARAPRQLRLVGEPARALAR